MTTQNETTDQIVARMNESLVGQPGIVMMTGENRPMYVGKFVSARFDHHLLIQFTNELVLLFLPLLLISVVDKESSGKYPVKTLCDELFIGEKILREIILGE
jgi:hypothetical protein